MKGTGQRETRLRGIALSEGHAVARVCLFNEKRHSNLPLYRVVTGDVPHEVARLRQAVAVAAQELNDVQSKVRERLGAAEAEIFVAQQMILEDTKLQGKIIADIEEANLNAESAVARTLDEYEARLLSLDNEYIRERATDFGEIKRRILDVLANMRPSVQCAGEAHCQRGRNRIIVAEELTPSMTVDLDSRHLMGFVTERGGVNSHAAILARALGIPAVSGLAGIRDQVSCGDELIVDGDTGDVIVWPRESTVTEWRRTHDSAVRLPPALDPVPGFTVMANISIASEVNDAVRMKAEGIGLYRTEIEAMAAGRLLSEDEMFERYASVMTALGGQPFTCRLLDLGSDKTLPALNVPREVNPSLGWRGSRLLLARPEILSAQARALARVSRLRPVAVLYPMIVDLEQFRAMKALFLKAVHGIDAGAMRHGVMFEVPSACLQAAEIFAEAEFASIGTNDLIQYLFAVDRDNERVAYDYHPNRDVFWTLLRGIAEAARRAGRPLSVCGEIAGNPQHLRRLLDVGISAVSVSARHIPAVRQAALEAIRRGQDDSV